MTQASRPGDGPTSGSGSSPAAPVDLLIIGGGINGCGIARDAAGQGLSVTLAEAGDLAGATSSASTKLLHGGLRYLEYFEFKLVREALRERETLLRAMPHISWPMRFVMPYSAQMRFDTDTPAARLLSTFLPWMRGRRPAWMIRLGLLIYDHLGGREILPGSSSFRLSGTPEGAPLQEQFTRAFEYSDCWVEDSRLVVLNARDAATRGATILTRSAVTEARASEGVWHATVDDPAGRRIIHARMIVNAAGPWVGKVIHDTLCLDSREKVRLVRGAHIVTRRLFDHDKCYIFQGSDARIVFAIPYERDFTLIGTTDAEHDDPADAPECSEAECNYLCRFASTYFSRPINADDVVWSFAGVRPLHDTGAGSATAATRDYRLTVDRSAGAPVLNIFGGKITTYRRLAEKAVEKIGRVLEQPVAPWTAGIPLPGGDFPVDAVARLRADLMARHPFLTEAWAARLIRAYGSEAGEFMGDARTVADLGRDFGATLSEAEVVWLMNREFARSAEDVVWRRSKLGLRMRGDEIAALDDWMRRKAGQIRRTAATGMPRR